MRNNNFSNSIERELENFRPDSHWDDDAIIEYYKKKTREICAILEEEEKIKKKEFLLNRNKNFLSDNKKALKNHNFKRVGSSFRLRPSNNNSKISLSIKRIDSAKPQKIKTIEEPESVLNMLFPYVNENDFKIEPFKSGSDLRNENRRKRENIPVIKVNQERRIKSNFLKKYKKYDKDLNTYADNPSIRRSSSYCTQEQIRRQEFLKSQKLWISTEDFKRYFSKNSASNPMKEKKKNEKYISNIYIEPSKINLYRIVNKNKWVSKKNFLV